MPLHKGSIQLLVSNEIRLKQKTTKNAKPVTKTPPNLELNATKLRLLSQPDCSEMHLSPFHMSKSRDHYYVEQRNLANRTIYTLFFYKEPLYKEPTCRRPKYLKNLYY